eukprot:gene3548-6283_t
MVQDFGIGLICLSLGIPVLALNERRSHKQTKLRIASEKMTKEIDCEDETEIEENQKKIIHTQGHLDLTDQEISKPKDELFGITKTSIPKALKIKLWVSMYQWVEHRSTTTKTDSNGKEVEVVSYTYTKEWKISHQKFKSTSFERPPLNPEFPIGLEGGRHDSDANISLGKIPISEIFKKEYPNDFTELPLKEANIEDENRFGMKKLESGFYSGSGSLSSPNIGDIHIKVSYVPEGDYTGIGELDESGLTFHKGKLQKNLRDEGEIKIPQKEINDLFTASGIRGEKDALSGNESSKEKKKFQFFIPNSMIETAEKFLLSMAPLQVGYLKKGFHSKKNMYDFIKKKDEETNNYVIAIGFFIIYVGCHSILGPVGKVAKFFPKGKDMMIASALGSAASISYATIEMNKVEDEKD